MSKGELKVKKILEDNNIKFEQHYNFNNCKYISYLFFDFYLPELNICIEYDGIQHFEPVDAFGGEENLKLIIKRDEIKNEYCLKNNIHFIRIKYTDNINDKLLEITTTLTNKTKMSD